jgi:quercetin dioxygenase-like cupin family protein
LISLAENRTSHRVSAEKYVSGDFVFSRVDYGNMRAMHAVAPAGAKLSTPSLHRDDYEMFWVVKGRIRFSLPREDYELTAGESIQFDALLPHTYEALTDSEIIITHLKKGKRF